MNLVVFSTGTPLECSTLSLQKMQKNLFRSHVIPFVSVIGLCFVKYFEGSINDRTDPRIGLVDSCSFYFNLTTQ